MVISVRVKKNHGTIRATSRRLNCDCLLYHLIVYACQPESFDVVGSVITCTVEIRLVALELDKYKLADCQNIHLHIYQECTDMSTHDLHLKQDKTARMGYKKRRDSALQLLQKIKSFTF